MDVINGRSLSAALNTERLLSARLRYLILYYLKTLTSAFFIKKIDNVFSTLAEFCNFYDGAGSVLDSQHYIHPWFTICNGTTFSPKVVIVQNAERFVLQWGTVSLRYIPRKGKLQKFDWSLQIPLILPSVNRIGFDSVNMKNFFFYFEFEFEFEFEFFIITIYPPFVPSMILF